MTLKNSKKMLFPILKIAVPGPFLMGLDYSLSDLDLLNQFQFKTLLLKPGMRVKVPLRNREVIGIILNISEIPDQNSNQNQNQNPYPLKSISSVLDTALEQPIFSEALFNLITWAAGYYHYPIGDCFYTAMPKRLCEGKPFIFQKSKKKSDSLSTPDQKNIKNIKNIKNKTSIPYDLTQEQDDTLTGILKNPNSFKVSLIQGITGSGKTEIYLKLAAYFLNKNQQVLILVPEIGLTPQTSERFLQRFLEITPNPLTYPNSPETPPSISTLHSQLSEIEKINLWVAAHNQTLSILIGTRSALFTPFKNLGLIIIDEEHDLSFKQQSQWKYHGRDLAIKRAQLENIPCVLGSATPSLESYYLAQQEKYNLYRLPTRPGNNQLPQYYLIDLRAQRDASGISKLLKTAIQKHLDLSPSNQILLFINRRGYAPALICSACGHVEQCTRCDVSMTLHHQPKTHLCCHHCGKNKSVPKQCPSCQEANTLGDTGVGTEKIELALQTFFPEEKIIRIDRDSTQKKNQLEQLLTHIHQSKARLLVGTQMIAKGHHFENLSMVGIINIDDGLFSADFRSTERMGQLITQVAGRAGRSNKTTQTAEVYIQTYQPEHPLLKILLQDGYEKFAQHLLADRKDTLWPPYSYLACLHAESKQAKYCLDFLAQIKLTLSNNSNNSNNSSLLILGPAPALIHKKSGSYHYHLLLQSDSRAELHLALKNLMPLLYQNKNSALKIKIKTKFNLDVDPQAF